MGLITVAEANEDLDEEIFPEWDALEDNFRQRHINRSGSYIRLTWTSAETDFSWDDDTTWAADTKDVLAEYADADRGGLIYDEAVVGEESDSPIKRKKQKVGTLETEIEYDTGQSDEGSNLASLDDAMYALGYTKVGDTRSLIRT